MSKINATSGTVTMATSGDVSYATSGAVTYTGRSWLTRIVDWFWGLIG